MRKTDTPKVSPMLAEMFADNYGDLLLLFFSPLLEVTPGQSSCTFIEPPPPCLSCCHIGRGKGIGVDAPISSSKFTPTCSWIVHMLHVTEESRADCSESIDTTPDDAHSEETDDCINDKRAGSLSFRRVVPQAAPTLYVAGSSWTSTKNLLGDVRHAIRDLSTCLET